jgi:hypothetical protein
MRKETMLAMAGRETHSHMLTVVLCGLAGFALAVPAVAKDIVINNSAAVDVRTTVSAVREVPAGNPLPGLHFDAKVKGKTMDIYLAPLDFAVKYDVKVRKGDEVHIVGTEVQSGDADVVLAREITTGSIDKRTGIFHEDMTIYLRNDAGPLW